VSRVEKVISDIADNSHIVVIIIYIFFNSFVGNNDRNGKEFAYKIRSSEDGMNSVTICYPAFLTLFLLSPDRLDVAPFSRSFVFRLSDLLSVLLGKLCIRPKNW
jgi:hypothetical protein